MVFLLWVYGEAARVVDFYVRKIQKFKFFEFLNFPGLREDWHGGLSRDIALFIVLVVVYSVVSKLFDHVVVLYSLELMVFSLSCVLGEVNKKILNFSKVFLSL